MPEMPVLVTPPTDPIALLADVLARVAASPTAQHIDAEGLTPSQAAEFLGISSSKLHELTRRGLCPMPVQIGDARCPRFCKSELKAWLLAGAPSRMKWMALRDQCLRRAAG